MSADVLDHFVDRSLLEEGAISLQIQRLASISEFLTLESEWNEVLLQSRFPNIFLSWEWLSTWWHVFGAGGVLWVLVVRERRSGRLVAVVPSFLRRHPIRHGPCRELSLMGSTMSSGDHLDMICRAGHEQAATDEVAEFLHAHRREWDVLAMDYMAADSPLVERLRRQNHRPVMAWETVCPYLRLPERWDDLVPTLDKHLRQKLRQSGNRLEREFPGAVEYQRITQAADLPAAMEDLFRLHQEVRTGHGDQGAFCSPSVRDFHQRVAARFLAKGWLRLYLLKVRGETIAAEYSFRLGDVVSFYQTGYDRAWARYRPGSLTKAHVIRMAIEEGAREYDFLRGAEAYKTEWTGSVRCDTRTRLATTARGNLTVWSYRTFHAARSKWRAWREAKRTGAGAGAAQ